MSNKLIKQAALLPIIYFGLVFIASLFAVDYSHLGQHASELGINESVKAVKLFEFAAMATAVSMMLLSLGLFISYGKRYAITAGLTLVFGITFVFGAIYPIGSPWHGAYGFGLIIMLLPFAFLYETKDFVFDNRIKWFTILAAFAIFFYFWAVVARLDPMEWRGLTQRVFGLVVFSWLAYVAYRLGKYMDK